MNIGGYAFTQICTIQPQRNENGIVISFFPQKDLQTNLPLLPWGEGPFCKFQIPNNLSHAGVYALTIDRNLIYYIGETVNLSQRFNGNAKFGGYGLIQPHACFLGGQSTNLRINSNIYHANMAGIAVDLWFYQTAKYKEVEADLIALIKPKWNYAGVVVAELPPFLANQQRKSIATSQPKLPRTSTCRDEILSCLREIIEQTGKNEFTVEDVIHAMQARGTSYKTTTINIHVTSKMCLSGPNLHSKRYDDFQYLGNNKYRLKI